MLKSLKLHNICQHADREIALSPGTTAVLGPNGCGKSNMVEALFFLLTGDTLGHPSPSALLRFGKTSGYVEGEIEREGDTPAVLRRSLKRTPSGVSVSHNIIMGDNVLATKSQAAAALESMLGITEKGLRQIAFGRKANFDELLLMQHGDRTKTLYQLLELDKADILRSKLQAARSGLPTMLDRSTDLQQLVEQLTEMQVNLQELQTDCATGEEALEALGPDYKQAIVSLALRDQAAVEARRAFVTAELKRLAEKRDTLAGGPGMMSPVSPPDYELRSKALALMALIEEENLLSLPDEREALPKGLGSAALQEQRKLLAVELKAGEQERIELARKIKLASEKKCFNCGHDTSVPEVELMKMVSEESHLQKWVDELEGRERKTTEDIAEAQAAEAATATRLKRLGELRTAIDGYPADTLPSFDPERFAANEAAYAAYCAAISQRDANQRKLRELDIEIDRLSAESLELAKEQTIDAELRAQLEQVVVEYDKLASMKVSWEVRLAELHAKIEMQEQLLSRYRAEQASGVRMQETASILEESREVLHPDCLPMVTAQSKARQLNKQLLQYLRLFSFPYLVRLNDELDFEVVHPDNERAPITILSTGQLMMVAVALRFAFFELLGSCPLIVLDEPIGNLDPDNIDLLVEVLTRANEHLRKRNTIIWVPTHCAELRSMADQVLDLGETA